MKKLDSRFHMYALNKSKIIFIALIFIGGVVRSADTQGEDGTFGLGNLPSGIVNNLKKTYRNWNIQSIENLDNYDKDLWNKSKSGNCPGVISGHFVSEDFLSYAVLLVPKPPTKDGYKVVVFLRYDKNKIIKPTILTESEDQVKERQVIWVAPKGEYSSVDGTEKIRLKKKQ